MSKREKPNGTRKVEKRRKKKKVANDVHIHITACVANQNKKKYLHWKNDDRAKWVSDDDCAYEVIFQPDTPFNNTHTFAVPAHGSKSSGKITDQTDRDWNYRIKGVNGCDCDIDPIIHIGP